MRNLFDAVPASLRGAHAANSLPNLAPVVAAHAPPGRCDPGQGQPGSGMKRVVEAIEAAGSRAATVTAGAG